MAEREEVEEAYLVGSLARGDHQGGSDADVLLVLRSTDLNPVERSPTYLPFFSLPVGVDVLAYAREELARMRETRFPPPFLGRRREARRLA